MEWRIRGHKIPMVFFYKQKLKTKVKSKVIIHAYKHKRNIIKWIGLLFIWNGIESYEFTTSKFSQTMVCDLAKKAFNFITINVQGTQFFCTDNHMLMQIQE